MADKADNLRGTRGKSEAVPEPEPPPNRVSSDRGSTETPLPRAARFGEGPEGRSARRERSLVGRQAAFFERVGQFWRDIRAELKRTTWPSAHEVRNTTTITVIAVIFFAVYLFAVDQVLAFLIAQLFRLANWLVGAI